MLGLAPHVQVSWLAKLEMLAIVVPQVSTNRNYYLLLHCSPLLLISEEYGGRTISDY